MSVYKWKPNTRIKIGAQVAGERLEKIANKHGGKLHPLHIVADAQSARSPLHPYFEWDNDKAAYLYRIEQARFLIRKLVVADIGGNQSENPIRAFVSITTDDHPSYHGIASVMSDETMRAQLLEKAHVEFHAWRDRYKDLQELAEIFAAHDRLIAAE